jgi:hypothetical protein
MAASSTALGAVVYCDMLGVNTMSYHSFSLDYLFIILIANMLCVVKTRWSSGNVPKDTKNVYGSHYDSKKVNTDHSVLRRCSSE